MNILVLGSDGQLGSEISKKIKSFKISRKKFKNFDFEKKNNTISILKKFKIKYLINCVAYTDVNKAEIDKKRCKIINAKNIKYIAEYCKKKNITLIHFSTDYVYDGKKKIPYSEKSIPKPINYYGKMKYLGDKYIEKSGCRYFIFRISWIYNKKFMNNFVSKIKNKILSNEDIRVPSNQIGSPTSVQLIAKCIKSIIELDKNNSTEYGLYNLCGKNPSSRYLITKYIAKILKKNNKILPYQYIQSQNKIKRPLNSSLDTSKIQKKLKFKLPDWRKDLRENI
tara:strand:- start:5980 stop:6822 length:843 start_codon:yes stop_codon:yes gene_type:complete